MPRPSLLRIAGVGSTPLLGILLAALGCGSSSAEPEPPCGELARALVEQCAEAYETLTTCIEASGAQACDPENLAHGRCVDGVEADYDEELHDPAFSRYLCEVGSMPADDCAERIAACGD